MYSLEYTRDALKDMRRIPVRIRETIQARLLALAKSPAKAQGVKALRGEKNSYRLRVR